MRSRPGNRSWAKAKAATEAMRDLADGARRGDDDRVEIEAQERDGVEDVAVVFPADLARDQAGFDRKSSLIGLSEVEIDQTKGSMKMMPTVSRTMCSPMRPT